MVVSLMEREGLIQAGRTYFEQAMESPTGLASVAATEAGGPVDEHMMVLPGNVLELALGLDEAEEGEEVNPGAALAVDLASRWGITPPDHTVITTKEGMVRFPDNVAQSPSGDTFGAKEGLQAVREAAASGVCRPAFRVHFRPWADPAEQHAHTAATKASHFLAALLVFFQRRLLRAKLRADAVAKQIAVGAAAEQQGPYQTYSWGAGAAEGQLGRAGDSSKPAPIPLLAGQKVAQLSASGNHAFALLGTGELLSWGGGQLGVTGRQEEVASRTPLPCTVKISRKTAGMPTWNAARNTLRAVATGPTHSLALLEGGRVYGWGAAWLGQLGNTQMMANGGCLLPFRDQDFAQSTGLAPGTPFPPEYAEAVGLPTTPPIAPDRPPRGPMACVALLEAAPVMQFGMISPSQHTMPANHALDGVVAVAAGGVHSAAVTKDGALLVWGCNDGGTLGVPLGTDHIIQPWVQSTGCNCQEAACAGPPKVISISSPVRVDLTGVASGRVVEVACGSAITVARTDTGEVVSWGAAWRDPFRADSGFPDKEVGAAVAAGGAHALALTSPGGQVYYWSRPPIAEWELGMAMKMGGAGVHKQWVPRRVAFVTGGTLVACSTTHGAAATKDGRVLLWPHNAPLNNKDTTAYDVPGLAGMRVLTLAVGDHFALAATGPQEEGEEQQQQ